MRLVWFRLHGFKRFEASTDVHLDGRLIALSEAGKSSLLEALAPLSHTQPLSHRELTRRTAIPEAMWAPRSSIVVAESGLLRPL